MECLTEAEIKLLKNMNIEANNQLKSKIIPFWESLIDKRYGGFYSYVGFDLKVDENYFKGCILNSRILWFFSNAYMMFSDKKLLECANYAYEFLKAAFIDYENGGVCWSVTSDGIPLDTTKHTYNQAFAIYGLSAYYEATKKQQALRIAESLYNTIEEKCTDEFGYLEALSKTFEVIPNDKLSENGVMADKTMNTLLHVLESYQELYKVSGKIEIKNKILSILDLFQNKIYNSRLKRQEVFFDKRWNSLIDLHSYGHDIETSWLVERGLEIIDDNKYSQAIRPITKSLAEKIYTVAYENHSLMCENENGMNKQNRVWWVQAETVIGFLNQYQKNVKAKNFLLASDDVFSFIIKNVVDKRHGSEWFNEVDENGLPKKMPIVNEWKCPYHNGRMCFEVIKRTNQLLLLK